MSTATAWDELVGTAVLGTERRPFTPPVVAGMTGPVVSAAGAAAGLAGVAAAVWAWRQAGRVPAPPPDAARPRREPAPPDGRSLLAPGPVRTLAAILDDTRFHPVLPEWLGLAARDGRRLPAEWLPGLLDACGTAERPLLDAVAGPRAAWLAAHREGWSRPAARPGAGGRRARRPPATGGDAPEAAAVAGLARAPLAVALPPLLALPRPWSPQVSRSFLERLAALIATGDTAGAGPVRDALREVGLALDPSSADAAAALAAGAEQLPTGPRGAARLFWASQLSQLAVTVSFRQAMHQEFR